MRKLTAKAINAFLNSRSFSQSNTEIRIYQTGIVEMYLYNTCIARRYPLGKLLVRTGGFPTPTTKERLNGLPGVSARVCKGQLYLNGYPWDGSWKALK